MVINGDRMAPTRPKSETPRDILTVTNWGRWQSYRRDRGAPPWIKVHRNLPQNPEWVMLDDRLRGQLVAIWILAASKDGTIEAPAGQLADFIHRAASMSSEPDLQTLEAAGFVSVASAWRHDGVNVASSRRHGDAAETETETEVESTATEGKISCPPGNPVPIGDRARDVAPAFDPDSAFVWEN